MTKKQAKVKAPPHLRPATKRWFEGVAADYVLESHHLLLLELAARSWDRAEEARKLLDAEGLTVTDRYGQTKPHPAVGVEKDSQLRFARLVRELGLDLGEPEPPNIPRAGGQKW